MAQQFPWIRKKLRWVSSFLSVALFLYFLLPLSLVLFPDFMYQPGFFLGIPRAWLYALSQIPMTWSLGWLYHLTASSFERKMTDMKNEGK